MRQEGRLKKWNDERGFGFITADRDGSDFFGAPGTGALLWVQVPP